MSVRVRAAVAALLLGVAACSTSPTPEATPPVAGAIVVASFNFSESELLAEIYALSLEDAGVPVQREVGLGPRELVMPALRQGRIDIVPEYLGTALADARASARAGAVGADAPVGTDPEAVSRELAAAVEPWGLRVLGHAEAQNQNALVVTTATALRRQLNAISDLAPIAGQLTLGGPPECPTRRYCLLGLTDVYGLSFADFIPLASQTRVERALADDVIDVGVLFTTDGVLAGDQLVLLEDDRRLQPAENVVPLVRAAVLDRDGGRIEAALGDVTNRLSTATLRFLNWRVTVAGNDAAAEARAWLLRQGLIHR